MILRLAQWSFLLLVFSLPFVQPIYLRIGGSFIQITELLFLLTAVLWFVAWLKRKIEIRFDSIFIPIGFYLFALFLSTIFSTQPEISRIKIFGAIYLVGLAFLTVQTVQTPEVFRRVILSWLWATVITLFAGFITIFLFYIDRESATASGLLHHYGSLPPGNYPRIQSTFFYPSMLCNYLNISLMLGILAWRRKWINKTFFAVFCLIFFPSVFFTLTPGLGGIVLSLCGWLYLVFRSRKQNLSAKLSLLTGGLAAVFFIVITLFSPVVTETAPYKIVMPLPDITLEPSQRLQTWQSGLETWRKYPILGKGVGTATADVKYLDASGRWQHLTDAHNIWLNVAGQTGFIGFLAVLLVTWYGLSQLTPFYNLTEDTDFRFALALAFAGVFVYQGLTGSFEDARHIWVLIGLMAFVKQGRRISVK